MTPPTDETQLTDTDIVSMHTGAFVQQVARMNVMKGRIFLPDGSPALGAAGDILLGDPDKAIVIGVRVANGQYQAAQSNPDGTYEIHPNFKSFRLVLQHPAGYAIALSEDLATDPDLHLVPWSHVSGVLQIDDAPAPAGRTVQCYCSGQKEFDTTMHFVAWQLAATTNAQGAFTFDRLPAVSNILISHPAFGPGYTTPEVIYATTSLEPGEKKTLTLALAGTTVRGKLASSSGVPLPTTLSIEPVPQPSRQTRSLRVRDGRKTIEVEGDGLGGMIAHHVRQIPVGADGTFSVATVPGGSFRLVATNAGSCRHAFIPGAQRPERCPLELGTLQMHSSHPLALGDTATELSFHGSDGQSRTLHDFQGKYVVVVFIWPGTDMQGISEGSVVSLSGISPQRKEQMVVVGMTVGADSAAQPGQFGNAVYQGAIAATDASVVDAYGLYRMPAAVLIGPDGKLVAVDLHNTQECMAAMDKVLPRAARSAAR